MIRGRPRIALLPIFFLFLLLLALPALGQTLEWVTVVKIIDGDTLIVEYGGKEEKVRFIGIDCPECRINPKAQKEVQRTGEDIKKIIEIGQRSTAFTESLVKKGFRDVVD
jgi:endonuclease YncB( thermonuclease family)